MIRIVCDNCGRELMENSETLNDYREVNIIIKRGDLLEARLYHLCAEPCVQRFKEFTARFMSE